MIKLVGDWAAASRIVETMAARFTAAADRAVLQEAHYLRGQMVQNITSGGALAGAPFAPLSPATLLIRRFLGFGGGKPLLVSGALRNGITVRKMPGGGAFVGVLRQGGGKRDLANVAEVHEFGAGPFQIVMTDRQRRFLMAALRSMGGPGGPGRTGGGVLVIRIPPRPFIGPVVDRFARPEDVRRRFFERVGAAMGGDLGR